MTRFGADDAVGRESQRLGGQHCDRLKPAAADGEQGAHAKPQRQNQKRHAQPGRQEGPSARQLTIGVKAGGLGQTGKAARLEDRACDPHHRLSAAIVSLGVEPAHEQNASEKEDRQFALSRDAAVQGMQRLKRNAGQADRAHIG